ncbi:hypothetical protein Nepgr_022991 [Nepenthes gracilis]|uniref:Transmembrane protein n=1 Tax=Nepenthes gracilis TaxID=150966 RepID=A0AAD3XYL8_NEPGR|nr:hypothetical protein Nepgr_022991 [Nepenthes gracilis]
MYQFFGLGKLLLFGCLRWSHESRVCPGLCYGAVLEPFAGVRWSAAVSAAAVQSRVSSLAFTDAEVYSLEDHQTPLEDPMLVGMRIGMRYCLMQLVLFSTPKDGAAGFWYWSIPGLVLLLHFNFEEYGFCHFCCCGLLLLPACVQIVLFADACMLLYTKLEFPPSLLHWIVMVFAGFDGLFGAELRLCFIPGVLLMLKESLLVGFAYLIRALLLMENLLDGSLNAASDRSGAVRLAFVMLIIGAMVVLAVSDGVMRSWRSLNSTILGDCVRAEAFFLGKHGAEAGSECVDCVARKMPSHG